MVVLRSKLHPARIFRLKRRQGIVALIDQAVVSAVNFVTGLILARYLSRADFGTYALLFASLMAINALQSALITSPLMVLVPRYQGARLVQYLRSLSIIQLIGCLATGVGVAIVVPTLHVLSPGSYHLETLPLVLLFTTYLCQEFMRRLLFARQNSSGGLLVDLISYGLQFIVLVALIAWGRLSFGSVVWAIGLTSLISCIYGFWKLRPLITSATSSNVVVTWHNHVTYGRWLLGTTLARWASSQIYLYVVAFMLSTADSAVYAASRNLFGFANIFLLSLENFVPATATRHLIDGGIEAMDRWIRRFRLLITITIGVYCLMITLFAEPILHLVFGPQYSGAGTVVMLFALTSFLEALNRGPIMALRALDETRQIFYGQLAAAVVAVIISVPMIRAIGINGAAVGLLVTQIITNMWASLAYHRILRAREPSVR